MGTFTLPHEDKLPALIALTRSIKRNHDLPDDFEQQISELLGVEDACWRGLVGAFALRDIVFAGHDYLNIEFREYNTGTDEAYFLVKIENEHFESSGRYHTRQGALLKAILDCVVFQMELADERYHS
jgi:hypothetical protein